ncbi:hypothetical protein E2C01_045937 [Portunus trituberculatus]|uniref:Uncharacterized protein n=1 Tax=Portunus trituberculatus TaxID=210409 RepID=A0A5B7G3B4_PORTR|nr:hypothetical protein [Portunus trituberculatus]
MPSQAPPSKPPPILLLPLLPPLPLPPYHHHHYHHRRHSRLAATTKSGSILIYGKYDPKLALPCGRDRVCLRPNVSVLYSRLSIGTLSSVGVMDLSRVIAIAALQNRRGSPHSKSH